jgi:hypothetical protein
MARRLRPLVPPRPRARRLGSTGRRAGLLPLAAFVLFLGLLGAATFFFIQSRPLVITLNEAQVQQRLEPAFPVRREVLLVAEVVLSRPQVTLTLGSDRVGFATDCAVHLLGRTAIRGQAYLSGGLRLDPARGDLFLQEARVERLEVPGLPSPYDTAVTAAASEAAGEYLGRQPIYHLPHTTLLSVPLLGELRIWGVSVEDGRLKVILRRGARQ